MMKVFAENTSNGPKAQEAAYTKWAANAGAQQFGIGRNTAIKMTKQYAVKRTRPMKRQNFVKRVNGQ